MWPNIHGPASKDSTAERSKVQTKYDSESHNKQRVKQKAIELVVSPILMQSTTNQESLSS